LSRRDAGRRPHRRRRRWIAWFLAPRSSNTSPIATLAPASTINRAVAAPIPRAAPEMKATLPSRRFIAFAPFGGRSYCQRRPLNASRRPRPIKTAVEPSAEHPTRDQRGKRGRHRPGSPLRRQARTPKRRPPSGARHLSILVSSRSLAARLRTWHSGPLLTAGSRLVEIERLDHLVLTVADIART